MSGTILRRRDRTARPPRVEHYSSADRSQREKHGALLDAELLTEVYLELIGGRQPGLELQRAVPRRGAALAPRAARTRAPRTHAPSEAEAAAHAAFVATLKAPIWNA